MFAIALKFFLSHLPTILNGAVTLAELMHPAPGSGAAKAQFVLGAVAGLASNHPELVKDVTAVVEAAKPLMESAVTMLKDSQVAATEYRASWQKFAGEG